MLPGFPAFQVGEDFHVSIKARGTASKVLADKRIGLAGMLGQAGQFAIGRTVDPLRIGKRLGEIRLGEVEELFLVNLSPLSFVHWFLPPRGMSRQAVNLHHWCGTEQRSRSSSSASCFAR